MPPTTATLSTALTTPHLTARREWPLTPSPLPRELPSIQNTSSSSSSSSSLSSSSSSQNGTNFIALIVVILALLTLIISFVAADLYHKYQSLRWNPHQKSSTTAKPNDGFFELQDHHHDFGGGDDDNNDHKDKDEEVEKEEEEELPSLEQVRYRPINHKNNQIKLCIAQTVRVYPPGSASMVDIRNNGLSSEPWYSLTSLPHSKSVRDVSSLPDLSSARAILSSQRSANQDDDDGPAGRMGRTMGGAKVNVEGLAMNHQLEEMEKQKKKMEKMERKREPPAMRVRLMPEEEEAKGLRRALKKRISTQRLNFQRGGMREFVRSIGF